MLMLSTSPGPRGAATVLETAKVYFPFPGANIVAVFSLPSYNKNFSKEVGITDKDLNTKFKIALEKFRTAID